MKRVGSQHLSLGIFKMSFHCTVPSIVSDERIVVIQIISSLFIACCFFLWVLAETLLWCIWACDFFEFIPLGFKMLLESLWVYIFFVDIVKVLITISSKLWSASLFLFSFWDSDKTISKSFGIVPEVPEVVCYFSVFFPLLFKLDNFYWSILKFNDLFSLSSLFCYRIHSAYFLFWLLCFLALKFPLGSS